MDRPSLLLASLPADVQSLLQQRSEARQAGDISATARLTGEIFARGYQVRDTPTGVHITAEPSMGTGAGRGRGRGRATTVVGGGGVAAPVVLGRGRGRAATTTTATTAQAGAGAGAAAGRGRGVPAATSDATLPPLSERHSAPLAGHGRRGRAPDPFADGFHENEWSSFGDDPTDYYDDDDDDNNDNEPVSRPATAVTSNGNAASMATSVTTARAANSRAVASSWSSAAAPTMAVADREMKEQIESGMPENYQWRGQAKKWAQQEYGAIASRDPKLEAELFSIRNEMGINFDKYSDIEVRVSGDGTIPAPVDTFEKAGLEPLLRENIALAGLVKPTPVQQYSLPIMMAGRDLMACAQTGSGKTAAFLLPMLCKMLRIPKSEFPPQPPSRTDHALDERRVPAYPFGLVLAPTRELACQTFDESRKFSYRSHIRPLVVYGGAEIRYQMEDLQHGSELIIGTPGRLMDLMGRNRVSLKYVRYLVLDEADRMLDMGFEPQIRQIIQQSDLPGKRDRQTSMFSATFPSVIRNLASEFLFNELHLNVGRIGTTNEFIKQEVVYVEGKDKRKKLIDILRAEGDSGLTLVFTNTKRDTDVLESELRGIGMKCVSIHGDLHQWEREEALRRFRNHEASVMVATNVAQRGLDIPNITHVVNYDTPSHIDDYIHRIGRTGRVGNAGKATTLVTKTDGMVLRDLERFLRKHNQPVPEWFSNLAASARPAPRGGGARDGGGRDGGGGGGAGGDRAAGGRRRGGGGGVDSSLYDDDGGVEQDLPNVRDWDKKLFAQIKRQEPTGAAPQQKVYASSTVVSGAAPSWMDDDD